MATKQSVISRINLANKRFLITQPMMHWICGSTIVTLELAEYLKSQGAKVTIYTCFYDEPLKTICKRKKIKVDEAKNHPQYKLTDFDYIWIHSQILPPNLITELGKKLPTKLPNFIFLHMSGMDWIPDEKPWIHNLENLLSSKTLFISEEVQLINQPMLDQNLKTDFFRNPSPESFKSRSVMPHQELKSLLIVSNHPPEEIAAAKDILIKEYGINVKILGENQETYKLLDIKTLSRFDAVITIAKTTAYCLVSGTPVYIYDAYGGGIGWLNTQNLKSAKHRNFSGFQNRFYSEYVGGGFSKKTAKQIVQEIISGYQDALAYQTKNQINFQKEFLLSQVLPKILQNLQPRTDIQSFSQEYTEMAIAAQILAEKHFEWGSIIHNLDKTVEKLNDENISLQTKNQQTTQALAEAEARLQAKSYKLYNKIIKPYSKIKKYFMV